MKYNDYIYGFSVFNDYHFSTSLRIVFKKENEFGGIYNFIIKNAVKLANDSDLYKTVEEKDINFKFISLVFSGEIK